MNRKMLKAACAGLVLSVSGIANAGLITFEGFNNQDYSSPITRDDYVIGNVIGHVQHFHEIDSRQFALPDNGTGVLLNDRSSQLFVENSLGGIFSLLSVDVAGYLSSNTGLIIEGFLGGSSVGAINLASMGSSYTNLLGDTLGNVDRLVFGGINNGVNGNFVIDNLSLLGEISVPKPTASVPEPSTLAIFALGFMGLAARRFKK